MSQTANQITAFCAKSGFQSERAQKMFYYSAGWRTSWHTAIRVLRSTNWTFIASHFLRIAALLILNNAVNVLYAKLKSIPGNKVRISDAKNIVLLLICDYSTTIVEHDIHQTSSKSKLVFKRLSHRSSMSGIPVWRELLSRVDRHKRLHL
jgi:hypothetical protein